MKKIRKFKVNLRKRRIIRNLKISGEIKQITPQLEEVIEKEIKRATDYISPSSIFDTFKPDTAKLKFNLAFEDLNLAAVSIAVVTIGEKIEKEIDVTSNKGEHIRAQIMRAIGIEGYESSMNLIHRVLREEASNENCTLLPVETPPGNLTEAIVGILSGEKIGVNINKTGSLHPIFSSIGIIKWQSRRIGLLGRVGLPGKKR
jgi:hypothetical protein